MIAVVGGGIGGLAVARELDRAGADVVVLERELRPGGVVASVREGGRVLDLGPQRARLGPVVARLVEDLGLGDHLLVAPELPLLVYADGRLRAAPLDLRTALTTDLVAWRDRIRLLAEPLRGGPRAGETAAEFLTRKLGRRTYERVAGPLFGGLYASDPADMWARHALAGLLAALRVDGSLLRALARGYRARAAAPAVTFDGGLQQLTDALAATLGDRVRLGAGVLELRREGAGIRVVTDRGEMLAGHVVLTAPPAASAACLRTLDPEAAARLGRLRTNPIAVVHLKSDADLRVQGYQVALGTPHATHGVTSQHALFGRTGLYTAFLGGGKSPALTGRTDAEIEAVALREFREMTGHDADALHVHRTAMPAWDRSWAALDGLVLPPGVSACASWNGRAGLTGRLVAARREAAALVPPAPAAAAPPLRRRSARVRA